MQVQIKRPAFPLFVFLLAVAPLPADEAKKRKMQTGDQMISVEPEEVHEPTPAPNAKPEPPPPPPILQPHSDHDIEVTASHVVTPHDCIPRFGVDAKAVAVKSGLWSDASTWRKPPVAGDSVQIPSGVDVTYDRKSADKLGCIEVAGCLVVSDAVDTELWATELMVLPSGCLRVEPGDRRCEVVFPDGPLATTDTDQLGRGLLVFGELKVQGKPLVRTFVRADGDVKAGSATVALRNPVNWPAGSEVLIPDTRHINPASHPPYYEYEPQWELRKVAQSGSGLRLDRPLKYDHRGPRDLDGSPTKGFDGKTLTPHVACLSRSVVFRSENKEGVRGHVQLFGEAQVCIRHAEFRDLGRTKTGPLDNATNHIGRYALHAHHLVGRAGGIDGHQFVIEGNSVVGAKKWGITVHGTHYGLIRGNVLYNVDGAGIATENGAETGNLFDGNFVCRVNGKTETKDDLGDQGDGFWFTGPLNSIRNNVATNCYRSGYEYTPDGMPAVDNRNNRPVDSPVSPLGEIKKRNLIQEAVRDFVGNEAYGATEIGIRIWSMGDRRLFPSDDPADINTLRNGTFWHLTGASSVVYYADSLKCDGWIHRSNPALINKRVEDGIAGNPWIGEAIFNGGSVGRQTWLLNADVQGSQFGYFHRGHGFTDHTELADMVMDNATSLLIYSWAQFPPDGSSDSVYRNILFKDSYSPGSLRAIKMEWQPYSPENAVVPETHTVINFQRIAGLDLDLYYHEQSPAAQAAMVPDGSVPKGRYAPVELDGDNGEAAAARGKAMGIDGLVFVKAAPKATLVFANVLLKDERPFLHYAVIGGEPKVSVEFRGKVTQLKGATGSLPLTASHGLHPLKVKCGSVKVSKNVLFPVKR